MSAQRTTSLAVSAERRRVIPAGERTRPDPVRASRIVAFSLAANDRFGELIERLRAYALAVDFQTPALLASRPRRGIYLVGLDGATIAEATTTVEWSLGCKPQPGLVAVIANGGGAEREQALVAGFDDAITEPVSARELVGRMRAMQRRLHRPACPSRVGFGAVILDLRERIAWTEIGQGHNLTAMETAVLQALIEARGSVLTYAELFRDVWGSDSNEAARHVQGVVKRLRRKLGRMDAIEIVREIGARLAPA